MRIVFCAYRDWAHQVQPAIERHPRVTAVTRVYNNPQLYRVLADPNEHHDLVLFCGWSTPPDEWATQVIPMFSEHPATSDRYSPGTPLQNQILDGLRTTKHRLVKVGYPELSLRQWSHEVDMSLAGNMDDVLDQMEASAKALFTQFLDDYPNITWHTWDALPAEQQVPRRTPDMSRLTVADLEQLTTRQLYDKIRCLEAPYPNAYVEDAHGRLYFERVSYKAKQ